MCTKNIKLLLATPTIELPKGRWFESNPRYQGTKEGSKKGSFIWVDTQVPWEYY